MDTTKKVILATLIGAGVLIGLATLGQGLSASANTNQSTGVYWYTNYNDQHLLITGDGWTEPVISAVPGQCGITVHIQTDHIVGPQSNFPQALNPAVNPLNPHDANTHPLTLPACVTPPPVATQTPTPTPTPTQTSAPTPTQQPTAPVSQPEQPTVVVPSHLPLVSG